MNQLFLADLAEYTDNAIRKHLLEEWEVPEDLLKDFEIIIAYESVGSWGCDSSAWYLLRHKKTKKLYEVHGSHCSCNGFEGQFEPEETTLIYLKSSNFYFSTGGYDNDDEKHIIAVKYFISDMTA
jgi:hypothetical protein